MDTTLPTPLVEIILQGWEVDAVYLYGSRSRGVTHEESDWDVAVLFTHYLSDRLEGLLRPQEVEAVLQRSLNLYDQLSVVDLELVPPPLQFNIICGKKLYDRLLPHVRRVEHSIISRIEKDYECFA